MKNYRNVIINSSLLFITASILEMTLHECGHFIAGIWVHAKNITLYHNYVLNANDNMSQAKAILFAGAGPLVSLVIAVLFHFICSRQKKRTMFFLFNLYFSVFGYIAFFGYLIIAPFFTYGDTGYIFYALGFPMWVTISIAIISGFILFAIMRKLIKYFVEMGTNEIISDPPTRSLFISALVRYPLYIGIVITTLLNLPAPTSLSLIYPLCSPFCIMWAYSKAISMQSPVDNMNTDLDSITRIKPIWVIIFLLVIAMNRLLVYGITVN